MALFIKQLREIDFADVEAFCETYPEGIRVEYKQEPSNIPKIISSFANTVGGIWVIGVVADQERNERKIKALSRRSGYEEQIIQACLTGIYPPLRPDVRVLDAPEDKMVIVVKVSESVEAPHAIENSTRAYIRTGSVSQPYELSDMDRLEYLFKRRQVSESRREGLIEAATRYCPGGSQRHMQIVVCPTYPYVPVRSLYEIAEFVASQRNPASPAAYLFDNVRQIQDGMFNQGPDRLLLNKYGLVLYDGKVDVRGDIPTRSGSASYIRLVEPVVRVGRVMNIARRFIGDTLINLLVRIKMFSYHGVWLEYRQPIVDESMMPGVNYSCYDSEVSSEVLATIEGIDIGMSNTVTELMRQVLWAFNRYEPDLRNRIEELQRVNRLVP